MSNNKDFKVKNGIQPTSYFEGVGTAVSGSNGQAYNLNNAEYDSISFDVSSQSSLQGGLAFKADGTKMYILSGNADTGTVYQYTLSTAYDVSTASYDSVSFSTTAQDIYPNGIFFKPDGTKMYITGAENESLYEYTLSTAWSVNTASYSATLSLTGLGPDSLYFKSDGSKMYLINGYNRNIRQYSLSTAWSINTASYDSVFIDATAQDTGIRDIVFSFDGTIMFLAGQTNSSVFKYNLSTAWDLSTASYSSSFFSVSSQDTVPRGLRFKSDGSKMYLLGEINDTVYQYSTLGNSLTLDLSTGSVFEVTPTSDIQVTLSNPADSGTVSGATLLLDGGGTTGYDLGNASYSNVSFSVASEEDNATKVIFKPDGTKMYVTGTDSDAVQQYSLSSAFDVSTASYDSASFSVSSQDAGPMDISFNDDGTKLYMLGLFSDTLYQYSLSTAYDITTASYDSVSFSVTSQDGQPKGFTFNNDGTKLYYVGEASDSVYQYSLSTAFDLSTASYDSVSFSVNSQNSYPIAVSFNGDGTKMYVLGAAAPMSLFQYSLSTAFNLSTASYDSVSFDVSSQDTGLSSGITFSSNGTRLFLLGSGTRTVYQYSTATPATITYDTAIEWPGGTAPTSPAIGETDIITLNTRDGGITYSGVLAIDGAQ